MGIMEILAYVGGVFLFILFCEVVYFMEKFRVDIKELKSEVQDLKYGTDSNLSIYDMNKAIALLKAKDEHLDRSFKNLEEYVFERDDNN